MDANNITRGHRISAGGFMLISGILGYFVYGSIDGILGMIPLTFFFSLSLFLACIPFCGVAVPAVVMYSLIIPWVWGLIKVEQTWLVMGFFYVYLLMGLFLTYVIIVAIVFGIDLWKK